MKTNILPFRLFCWRTLLLLWACLPLGLAASATMPHRMTLCPADTSAAQPDDTAQGMNAGQKEYLNMKKAETIEVMDAGEGNYILLATAAWEHNRTKVEHIFWVPRDIARYGRVNKEIRERRTDPHAHLTGIPVRKLILHAPSLSKTFYTIATSDNLVLANGEGYDSKNAAHQGQPLYTVWEEHRISTEAGNWLRLLIGNQLSTLTYQGPSIPQEKTKRTSLKEPQKLEGATEEEWRDAVMPEVR